MRHSGDYKKWGYVQTNTIGWNKGKKWLTVNVFHQNLCQFPHFVPEGSGDVKVCHLSSNTAVFDTWFKGNDTNMSVNLHFNINLLEILLAVTLWWHIFEETLCLLFFYNVKEACLEDFLIFVNNEINIDSKVKAHPPSLLRLLSWFLMKRKSQKCTRNKSQNYEHKL